LFASSVSDPSETKVPAETTCIDFEHGWNSMQATHGVYVQSRGVTIASDEKFGNGS